MTIRIDDDLAGADRDRIDRRRIDLARQVLGRHHDHVLRSELDVVAGHVRRRALVAQPAAVGLGPHEVRSDRCRNLHAGRRLAELRHVVRVVVDRRRRTRILGGLVEQRQRVHHRAVRTPVVGQQRELAVAAIFAGHHEHAIAIGGAHLVQHAVVGAGEREDRAVEVGDDVDVARAGRPHRTDLRRQLRMEHRGETGRRLLDAFLEDDVGLVQTPQHLTGRGVVVRDLHHDGRVHGLARFVTADQHAGQRPRRTRRHLGLGRRRGGLGFGRGRRFRCCGRGRGRSGRGRGALRRVGVVTASAGHRNEREAEKKSESTYRSHEVSPSGDRGETDEGLRRSQGHGRNRKANWSDPAMARSRQRVCHSGTIHPPALTDGRDRPKSERTGRSSVPAK